MELRSCDTAHFIQTIRSGVVQIVYNTIPSRSFFRFKNLKDIYESEDAKILQNPPALVFDYRKVKHESPCSMLADRTLQEIKIETDEFSTHAEDDVGSGLNDDTTLKQLKQRLRTKKRKSIPIDNDVHQDNENEIAAHYDSDLNEPLINLKRKRSMASNAKTKRLKKSANTSTPDVVIKSEENLVTECYPQVGGEPAPVRPVKVEDPGTEPIGCQNTTISGDILSIFHNEVPNPGQKTVQNENNEEKPLCMNNYGKCVTNKISFDHLEDVVDMCILVPKDGTSVAVAFNSPRSACRESLDFSSVEIEKQREIQDSSYHLGESHPEDPNADTSKEKSFSGTLAPYMATNHCMRFYQECNSEDKIEADFENEPNGFQSSLDRSCGSNQVSNTPSKTIAEKEQASICSVLRNELYYLGHIEDESLKAVEKQSSASTSAEVSLGNKTCVSAETILTPKSHQPPERLLSARKALSPSSQEQLRLAMNSDEICNDSCQNIVLECKEKLFVNQTENKSSPRSKIQVEVMVNHRHPGEVSQRKVPTGPKRVIRKLPISKGNLEGPRFSRALPGISTACTSVQGCSGGAVAFSQRQMLDMETLAEKLIKELKSMKDIVEQKLLFEAYRNASLKNDADEVKSAISNATKVEETAKRWMSMMARDCTRFCKIMEMTPESTTSKDTSPREKRKIRFADEDGGELCRVKYFFDSGVAPEAESDAVKQ